MQDHPSDSPVAGNGISCVIPVYNEEATIAKVIRLIKKVIDAEIIVVDDGSQDSSREILKQIPGIRLIFHNENKGYGHTILDGIRASQGDVIVTIDADGQHDPRDIPKLVQPVLDGECDLVVGSRYLGCYNYPLPFTTRAGEAILQIILNLFTGNSIVNNQNGFRAFSHRIVPLLHDLQFRGFALSTEILLRVGLAGYRIQEVPIRLFAREVGQSRIKILKFLASTAHLFVHYLLSKFKHLRNIYLGRVKDRLKLNHNHE